MHSKPASYPTRFSRFLQVFCLTLFYFAITTAGLGLAGLAVYAIGIWLVEAMGHTLALQGAGVLLAGGLLVFCWCAALACRDD